MYLPKKYLSYSAISLWEKNKEQFRKRYYENEPSPDTPEMVYGKKIAKILELGKFDGHPTLGKIPRYSHPEHKMEIEIEGIPLLGYIDSYDPENFRFIEYKTGRNNSDGKPRWTLLDVHKTDQLPMYSLMIKEKYGTVENLCHLVWMRTVFTKKTLEFEGHTLESDERDVIIDGHYEVFERKIYDYERKKLREKIIRIAHEIEDDYTSYKKTKDSLLPQTTEALVG